MLLTNTHSTINNWAIDLQGTPTNTSVNAGVITMCNSFIDMDEGIYVVVQKMEGQSRRSQVSEEKFIGNTDITALAVSSPTTTDRSCICEDLEQRSY